MIGSRAERATLTDWWLTLDRSFLTLVLLLAFCGMLASFVATPQAALHFKLEPFYFVKRHIPGLTLALLIVIGVSFLNPSRIRWLALLLFLGGITLMAAALLQGVERNGAMRWLYLGGAVIQPSEFAKPGLVVLCAWLFSESGKRRDMPALQLAIVLLAVMVTLLALQPDMGQAILSSSVWCGMFFLAGYSLRLLPLLGGVGATGVAIAYYTKDHVAGRIDRFFGSLGDAHQTTVAATAFRDAGWFGHGFGEGFQRMRLPDAHNDYVFAAIAEELGIAACLFVILIYAFMVWKVLRMAFREQDAFLRLAIAGLIMVFGFQALINMAVNLNMMPAKGVTLPWLSYGRSSMFSSAITLGMILALTRKSASAFDDKSAEPEFASGFPFASDASQGLRGSGYRRVGPL